MHTGVLLYAVCASTNKYLGVLIIRDISLNIKRYLASYVLEKKIILRYMYIKKVYELKLLNVNVSTFVQGTSKESIFFAPDSS